MEVPVGVAPVVGSAVDPPDPEPGGVSLLVTPDGVWVAPSTPPVGRRPIPRATATIEMVTTRAIAATDDLRLGRQPGKAARRRRAARAPAPAPTVAYENPHAGQAPSVSAQHQRQVYLAQDEQ